MMKSFNSHYYWLLVVLIFFFKGLEGFYIKHSSSGFCLRPLDPLRDSRVWGDFYSVGLTSDCLHSAAQFSYTDNGVLFNIFRDGCVVDVPGRTRVFEVWDGRPDNIGACLERFAVRQNSRGSLVFETTRECAVPKEPGGTARTNKSYVGDHIQLVNYCDRNVQQFLFGSVTCERRVTTNVTCGPSQVMVIKNAVYGRYGNLKTCGYTGDTTCTLSATCIVKRLCDGRQNCTIAVKTTMFKQDPCPGVQKYLYLEYNCVDRVASAKQFVVNDVRLLTSTLPNEGILEVNINHKRRKVCSKSLDSKTKEVVCRQLGYHGIKHDNRSISAISGNSMSFSGDILCSGNETTLSECCVNNSTKDEACSELAYISCTLVV